MVKYHCFETGEVILGHSCCRETTLKFCTDACRSTVARFRIALTASASLSTIKPVTPSSTISGTEPRLEAMTGVPQAMASIITKPKGSGQSIGKIRAEAFPRKSFF